MPEVIDGKHKIRTLKTILDSMAKSLDELYIPHWNELNLVFESLPKYTPESQTNKLKTFEDHASSSFHLWKEKMYLCCEHYNCVDEGKYVEKSSPILNYDLDAMIKKIQLSTYPLGKDMKDHLQEQEFHHTTHRKLQGKFQPTIYLIGHCADKEPNDMYAIRFPKKEDMEYADSHAKLVETVWEGFFYDYFLKPFE